VRTLPRPRDLVPTSSSRVRRPSCKALAIATFATGD
jgi:hypothetical protein